MRLDETVQRLPVRTGLEKHELAVKLVREDLKSKLNA